MADIDACEGIAARGKKSDNEQLSTRRLALVKYLLNNGTDHPHISFDVLLEFYRSEFNIESLGTLKRDIEYLINDVGLRLQSTTRSVAFPPFGVEQLWLKSTVSTRFQNNDKSKKYLASKTVEYLVQQTRRIHNILLGAGTMCWEISKELTARCNCANTGPQSVYTSNLLVLRQFIEANVDRHNLDLNMIDGHLARTTGVVVPKHVRKRLKALEIHAIVTSFYGLDDNGFMTGEESEIDEKLANLDPNDKTCKLVIIVMEWEKFGTTGIKVDIEGDKKIDLKNKKRRYVLLTNPDRSSPTFEQNMKLLNHWKTKGLEIKEV